VLDTVPASSFTGLAAREGTDQTTHFLPECGGAANGKCSGKITRSNGVLLTLRLVRAAPVVIGRRVTVKRFAKCADAEAPELCPAGQRDELLVSTPLFETARFDSCPGCAEAGAAPGGGAAAGNSSNGGAAGADGVGCAGGAAGGNATSGGNSTSGGNATGAGCAGGAAAGAAEFVFPASRRPMVVIRSHGAMAELRFVVAVSSHSARPPFRSNG